MTKPAVPYCTVKGFQKCLQLLRTDPPARIDRQVLVSRGLSAHAVYPVLGALRFLGLVGEDGAVTAKLQPFLDDDLAGKADVVREAYAEVLPDVPFPVEEREEVDRVLMQRHGCAPGVAAFCSTFFLWLAAEAGMPVAVLGRQRRGRPPAHLAQLSPAARGVLMDRAELVRAARPADEIGETLDDLFEGGRVEERRSHHGLQDRGASTAAKPST